jgi:hypothetical protein
MRKLKAPQSIFFQMHEPHRNTEPANTYREDAMLRSYGELIKRIPLVKSLVEDGTAETLEALYKNVSVN